MVNVFSLASEMLITWVTTLADFISEFSSVTINSLLEDYPYFEIVTGARPLIDFLGIGDLSILTLLLGGALYTVLIFNLIKWLLDTFIP